MTATAHALVAGAIATQTGDIASAAFLSVASHFLMDSIPHWDFGTHWRKRPKWVTGAISIAETITGITVAYFVFGGKAAFPVLTAAIFFGLLPDWLETPWYILFAHATKHEPNQNASALERLTFGIYKIENRFHTKTDFPFGAVTQVLTVLFFLLLLR